MGYRSTYSEKNLKSFIKRIKTYLYAITIKKIIISSLWIHTTFFIIYMNFTSCIPKYHVIFQFFSSFFQQRHLFTWARSIFTIAYALFDLELAPYHSFLKFRRLCSLCIARSELSTLVFVSKSRCYTLCSKQNVLLMSSSWHKITSWSQAVKTTSTWFTESLCFVCSCT